MEARYYPLPTHTHLFSPSAPHSLTPIRSFTYSFHFLIPLIHSPFTHSTYSFHLLTHSITCLDWLRNPTCSPNLLPIHSLLFTPSLTHSTFSLSFPICFFTYSFHTLLKLFYLLLCLFFPTSYFFFASLCIPIHSSHSTLLKLSYLLLLSLHTLLKLSYLLLPLFLQLLTSFSFSYSFLFTPSLTPHFLTCPIHSFPYFRHSLILLRSLIHFFGHFSSSHLR